MRKKFLSSILAITLIITAITPNIVKASTLNQGTIQENNPQIVTENTLDIKTNFNFINESDISDIQYTYEENGKSYYVYENANADLTEINTEIYEVGLESNLLVDQFTTYIEKNDDSLIVTKYSDGISVDSSIIDIKDGGLEINSNKPTSEGISGEISESNSVNASSGDTYNGYVNYDGRYNKYYTSWYYGYGYNGSNIILKFTYTVIIGILSGVSGNPYVIGGVVSAAQFILDRMIPDVYWYKEIYQVSQITYPDRRFYGSPIGLRTYVTFYSDSSRSTTIGNDFYEWHDPYEWPSIVIQ